ncbi:MAG: hypothetical protein CL607_09010 [Anaerolineaceae bacterium]|nr:hypothetical protein [Anaerolineaceae bacterium]
MSSSHPLFEIYPLDQQATISVGKVPMPYHTYDGYGVLIGGTADLNGVQRLLQDDQVQPIQTISGRALMGIWVVDFTDASLGPHHELQVSFLVAHDPVSAIEDHPLALIKALFVNEKARMFCYGLWNNTARVVAYNRELLGLDAKLSQSRIQMTDNQVAFNIKDEAGNPLLDGHLQTVARTPLSVGWSLMRLLGLRQTLRALSQPYLSATVVNPISETVPYNGDAQTYLAADAPAMRVFNLQVDKVHIGQETVAALDFKPQFVEHFSPFRFVYLQPERI